MEARVVRESGSPVVVLSGRLDATTASAFDAEMASLTSRPESRIFIDMTETTYISSAGLRSILQLIKHTAASGGRVGIFGASTLVMEVIEISGFPSLVDLYADREEALGASA